MTMTMPTMSRVTKNPPWWSCEATLKIVRVSRYLSKDQSDYCCWTKTSIWWAGVTTNTFREFVIFFCKIMIHKVFPHRIWKFCRIWKSVTHAQMAGSSHCGPRPTPPSVTHHTPPSSHTSVPILRALWASVVSVSSHIDPFEIWWWCVDALLGSAAESVMCDGACERQASHSGSGRTPSLLHARDSTGTVMVTWCWKMSHRD